MINKADLIKWLNGCIFKGHRGEGIRMWALRHVDADERSAAVEEWPYKNGLDGADLAEDVILTATRDAIGLEGVERYVLEAYFGTSKTRGKRYTCSIDGGARERDQEDGGFFSEPAGRKGDAMQSRRHIENMHRLSVGGANETLRILRSENEQLRNQVDRLMDKHFKVVDTYEELADKKHKRTIEIKEIEEDAEMKKTLLGQVIPLLPTFVMKALGTGQPADPSQPAAPEIQLFRAIADHIIKNQDTAIPALMQAFGGNVGLMAGIKELVDKYGTAESPTQ